MGGTACITVTVLEDPHEFATHQNIKYKYDLSYQNVLRTLKTFKRLRSSRDGVHLGHLATRQFIKMVRLIPVSTNLFFILTYEHEAKQRSAFSYCTVGAQSIAHGHIGDVI